MWCRCDSATTWYERVIVAFASSQTVRVCVSVFVFVFFLVQELIPLGIPRRQSSDGTSHPRPRLEPSEKTPKVSSTQPRPVLPAKNPELGRREPKVFNKSTKPEPDRLSNCTVVMRKLQANNGNIYPSKDASLSPAIKKEVQRTSSYKRDRDISLALSKELNENLRVTNYSFLLHFKLHVFHF